MSTHENCCCGKTDNWEAVQAGARETLGPEASAFIDKCMAGPEPKSQLIGVLHKVQSINGFLSQSQLRAVAQLLQVPAAKVTGVATFYHFFRLKPVGKYLICVCLGTACYVKGAERVAEKLQDELGIHYGETTRDGLFSLEESRCLGSCGLAPVLMVNGKVHATMTADKIPALIERYVKLAQAEAAAASA